MLHTLATTLPADTSSIFDFLPLKPLLTLAAALAIIAILIYWMRPAQSKTGFTIHVDDDDITFTGNFPHSAQSTVTDFLRNDVPLPGPYKISGHWEDRLLIIAVRGPTAAPHEQRIRNFLKLTLKQLNP